MSEYDELFNEANDDSKLVKKLRGVIEEKDSTLKEIQSQLDELRNTQRQQTLSATLADKGLNPKVAQFIPSDVTDIDGWLAENSDVFGGQPKAPEAPKPSDAELKVAMLEGELDQTTLDVPGDIESRIKNASSIEDLQRILGSR